MKGKPKIGAVGEFSFVVAEADAIDFAGDRMPAVLCTPRLIGYLERAAREALAPLLEEHESSVGVQVDVKHLAATPMGERVTCVARVINADKRLVTFQVEAHDEHEKIAHGVHRRRVIDAGRFRQRVEGKRR